MCDVGGEKIMLQKLKCNKNGDFTIPPRFDYAGNFSEGLAYIKIEDKYGYIDTNGEYITKPQFDFVLEPDFSEGMAIVKKKNRYGYIDKNGNQAIDFKYIHAYPFTEDGYAIVATEDKKYKIIT